MMFNRSAKELESYLCPSHCNPMCVCFAHDLVPPGAQGALGTSGPLGGERPYEAIAAALREAPVPSGSIGPTAR